MGITTYEDAVKAQAELEDQILADPNVVSVGVIAETNEQGEKTGSYIIKVGVISQEDYQNSLAHGESLIPREYKLHQGKDSQQSKSVRVQVVKTGEIKALSTTTDSKKKDFPSAIDDLPTTSSQALSGHTSRQRPAPGGYSIGHSIVTAGTLGLLLEYESGPNKGKAYLLSNSHVIAANNLAYVGDSITQPGRHDSGITRDTIAFLHRWVPLQHTGINFVDAAIAEVKGGIDWKDYVTPYVSYIGHPAELVDAHMDMRVEKSGRTTEYTTGTITSINQTIKVNYGKIGLLTYKKQIGTTSMSKSGDSGSCLFESGTRNPIGLLFAADDSESFYNPMKSVLSMLSMKHTNKYPSGKTFSFSSDYSLRILQKRPYSTNAAINFTKTTPTRKLNSLSMNYEVATMFTSTRVRDTRKKTDALLSKALSSRFFKLPRMPKASINSTHRFGIKFRI